MTNQTLAFWNFANTPEKRGKGWIFKLRVWNISAGHIMFGQYHKTDIPTSTDVGFVVDRVTMWQVSPSTSVSPCQYHSTIALYSFIHLPPTLYNVFLPELQVSPVSIIPPLLHTHSSIYHPRCIMFLSQYFIYPLSVSFHHCSILNHPSTTHAV